ncbi:MAG: c-type cytochrome [Pseudomonadota bacterium]|nr:c-type cytochrome [Pseudomonadota bacterium]
MRATPLLWRLVATFAGLAAAGNGLAAGDAAAGQYKFSTCTGCHSIPGYTNVYPTYHVPKLGGQHAGYIAAALNAYKIGDRPHPTMQANAANLSDEDMADIAAYLSGSFTEPDSRGAAPGGDPAAGRQKSAPCQACHGPDGNSPTPDFPRLAGQYADYLRQALADYKSGARKNPIMSGMMAGLSDRDIADLAAFYASQKGLAVAGD